VTTLTASGGVSYQWGSGEGLAQISVNDDLEHIVTVTDANGCTDVTSQIVTIHQKPIALIDGPDATCQGVPVDWTASGGDSYLWNTSAVTPTVSVNQPNMSVTVTNSFGCTAVATKSLTIHNNPIASISGDDAVCNGNNATF